MRILCIHEAHKSRDDDVTQRRRTMSILILSDELDNNRLADLSSACDKCNSANMLTA